MSLLKVFLKEMEAAILRITGWIDRWTVDTFVATALDTWSA